MSNLSIRVSPSNVVTGENCELIFTGLEAGDRFHYTITDTNSNPYPGAYNSDPLEHIYSDDHTSKKFTASDWFSNVGTVSRTLYAWVYRCEDGQTASFRFTLSLSESDQKPRFSGPKITPVQPEGAEGLGSAWYAGITKAMLSFGTTNTGSIYTTRAVVSYKIGQETRSANIESSGGRYSWTSPDPLTADTTFVITITNSLGKQSSTSLYATGVVEYAANAISLGDPRVEIIQDENVVDTYPDMFIANISKAKVSAAVINKDKGTVRRVYMQYPGSDEIEATYNANTDRYEAETTGPISGDTTFTMYLVDGFGLKRYTVVSIDDVVPYYKPVIRIHEMYRCDEERKADIMGVYYKVNASASIYFAGMIENEIRQFTVCVNHDTVYDLESGTEAVLAGPNDPHAQYVAVFTLQDAFTTTTAEVSLAGGVEFIKKYNTLVDKYLPYNSDLQKIPERIIGFPALMSAYYGTIDMELFLTSGLMPSVAISSTDAETEAAKLTAAALSPVAVSDLDVCSAASASAAALGIAKCIVRKSFRVTVGASDYNQETHEWTGNFIVTNYSDEEDTAESGTVTLAIDSDVDRYIRQKIEKMLAQESDDATSIEEIFALGEEAFAAELQKYCLNGLIGIRGSCQACLDIMVQNGVSGAAESELYTALYEPYMRKLAAIENEINIREEEIVIVTGKTESNENVIQDGAQTALLIERDVIQNALDFEKFIGPDLMKEFASYRRDDNYSNENYVSDGLNNAELFASAEAFIKEAKKEIYKSAQRQHSIDGNIHDLLSTQEYKPIVDDFEVGNWIRVKIDDELYKLRLYSYEIDYSTMAINVEFTDVVHGIDGVGSDTVDLLGKVRSISSSYGAVARQASRGKQSKDTLDKWNADGMPLSQTKIVGGENAEIVFDNDGLRGREYIEEEQRYSKNQVRMTAGGLYYTDDGWASSDAVVGRYTYKDSEGNIKDGFGGVAKILRGSVYLMPGSAIFDEDGNVIIDSRGNIRQA